MAVKTLEHIYNETAHPIDYSTVVREQSRPHWLGRW